MGYYTRFTGQIDIEPPLMWLEIKDSPFLPSRAEAPRDYRDAMFVVDEESIHTDEGVLWRKKAIAVRATAGDGKQVKAYSIVKHVQEIVDAYPGHAFIGHIEASGEESGDLWRLVVRDGKAIQIKPRLVWPDEEV